MQWGAFNLAELYRADAPLKDASKAAAAYKQAATAGNGWAHLVLAQIASEESGTSVGRHDMIVHFRSAAVLLGKDQALAAMLRIPTAPITLMVQQLLADLGFAVPITGKHGAETEASIVAYCQKNRIEDCDAKFFTRTFLAAVVLGD